MIKLDFKAHLQRLLDGAQKKGAKVFYMPHGIDAYSFDDIRRMLPRMRYAIDNQGFWKNSYGANFYPAWKPQPGDFIVGPHRQFNGFIGPIFEEKLRANSIEMVTFAGLTSHTCVEAASRHALEVGFHATFLSEVMAGFTERAHRCAADLFFRHSCTSTDDR